MDFKKKLKTRLSIAIGNIIAGLIMIGISFFVKTEGGFSLFLWSCSDCVRSCSHKKLSHNNLQR